MAFCVLAVFRLSVKGESLMATYGWLFDPKRCIDCKACEAACKQWNGVETGIDVRYRRVRAVERGEFPQVSVQYLSLSCNHCEAATCLRVCPTKAIFRRQDGIVLIQEETCVGCGLCAKFCPYQAMQLNWQRRKMEKCTMCSPRIDAGLPPACTTVCPTRALMWGEWDQIKDQGVDQVENFSPPMLTKPAIRFVTTEWKG